MQIRGAFKSFELQYTGQKLFIVHISKMYHPCVFVRTDCESDVIVIYDVIEH